MDNDPLADELDAAPLPRMGWRMQAVLDVLMADPSREVWPYYVDQHSSARGDSYQILKRLHEAGWLTRRHETGGPNARVLYKLTTTGEALAREAVERPVKWPDSVNRRRPDTDTVT